MAAIGLLAAVAGRDDAGHAAGARSIKEHASL